MPKQFNIVFYIDTDKNHNETFLFFNVYLYNTTMDNKKNDRQMQTIFRLIFWPGYHIRNLSDIYFNMYIFNYIHIMFFLI